MPNGRGLFAWNDCGPSFSPTATAAIGQQWHARVIGKSYRQHTPHSGATMDVKEWLISTEIRRRIKKFTYWAYSPRRQKDFRYGQATGYIIDPDKRIAVLITDFPHTDILQLTAGDFVHYKAPHPEVPDDELRIDSSATLRTDSQQPKIPCPDDRMPDQLDAEV